MKARPLWPLTAGLALGAAVLALGCDFDAAYQRYCAQTGACAPDAASRDVGMSRLDAATAAPDAAGPEEDAALSGLDAEAPGPDATAMSWDAGTTSPPDGGPGILPDAGGCPSHQTLCDGACVDTSNNRHYCGTCGHDCAGGFCIDGVCQPFEIRDDLDPPLHLGVNANGVFFAQETDPLFQILECPLWGCFQAPTVVGAAISHIYDLVAGDGTILLMSSNQATKDRPTLFYCADTGCPGSILTQALDNDGLGSLTSLTYEGTHAYWLHQNHLAIRHSECSNGTCSAAESIFTFIDEPRLMTTDATSVFFVDSQNELQRCPGSGTGCAPTVLASGISAIAMSQANALLYLLDSGTEGNLNGSIMKCTTQDCSGGSPTTVMGNLAYPLLFAQDATSAFWYADDTGVIQSAALQNPGTPKVLANGLAGSAMQQLHTQGDVVYWVQTSATAGKVVIMAVAK